MKYIDPVGKILAHVDRLAAWKQGTKAAPINIEWDLSNRCSLGCAGCHFAYTHTRGPLSGKIDKPAGFIDGGDLADVEMVKRALLEAKEAGVLSVTWTGGGEPTLHPAFDEIIAYADSIGLRQGLYTHGGHIDATRGALLSKTLDWCVVSIDCADAQSYAAYKGVHPVWFDKMRTGVANLKYGGGDCIIGASFLLGADNWTQARDMLKFSRIIGADYTTFRPMIEYDIDNPSMPSGDVSWVTDALPFLWALSIEADVECIPERFAEYRDWTQQRGYGACYGIRFNTVVTPNGKVFVCVNRREFAGSELGDLSVESFGDIWSRHPGEWRDFDKCRVLCRLHMINETVWNVYRPRQHAEFV
ncbi:MAG: radical SAM protein [Xanthomonadales bacterium]|nr:radical SAM protein [Xanthomonadales bacterium]